MDRKVSLITQMTSHSKPVIISFYVSQVHEHFVQVIHGEWDRGNKIVNTNDFFSKKIRLSTPLSLASWCYEVGIGGGAIDRGAPN